MTASGSRRKGAANWPMSSSGKERLVALDVDHEVFRGQVQQVCRLGQAVAARGMVGPGHHRLPAETLHAVPDARLVGGHPKAVQFLNLPGLLPDPLDQGLAGNERQGLPRKAGGAVAGGDKGHQSHGIS